MRQRNSARVRPRMPTRRNFAILMWGGRVPTDAHAVVRLVRVMNTFANIGAFIRVARLGSFSAAARELCVAPSAVTKRISQLEKEMGCRLVTRSTRGLALTAAGERYLPRLVRFFAEHEEIVHAAAGIEHRIEGRISIVSPPTITSMFVGTVLSNFQLKYPRVDMELKLMERSVNPLEDGFDIALTGMPTSYPDVMDVVLCRYDLVTVCSPSYLRNRDTPHLPTDLLGHQCLTTVLFRTSWAFNHPRGVMNVEVHSRMQSSDSLMVRDAARMGMGIAILPRFLVNDDLRAGTLVQLLEEFPVAAYWLKMLVPRMRATRPAVRELVACLKAAVQPVPPWER
jgi:DNA-binding transcriptional LysR family regulator